MQGTWHKLYCYIVHATAVTKREEEKDNTGLRYELISLFSCTLSINELANVSFYVSDSVTPRTLNIILKS